MKQSQRLKDHTKIFLKKSLSRFTAGAIGMGAVINMVENIIAIIASLIISGFLVYFISNYGGDVDERN
jgi:hypothetical protein